MSDYNVHITDAEGNRVAAISITALHNDPVADELSDHAMQAIRDSFTDEQVVEIR